MQQAQNPPTLFYGVALAAVTAEIAAALQAMMEYNILSAVSMHVAAIAFCGAWVIYSHRRYRDRMGLFLLPLTAAAGPFGAGIALLAALVHARCASDSISPAEWIESLFERHKDRESEYLHERITFGLDDFESAAGVEPFRDILSGGGVLQKQMAIAKIARYFRPAFAPLLLQAARDRNAAVRVQAATALARIERDFMSRYIRLENDLKDLPDHDPAKPKLAEMYDEYAHADLVDENTRQSLRRKAIHIFEACLAQHDNYDWRMKLGRLYIREDQPEKARECLQPLMNGSAPPRGAMLWYMEALFRLKQFGELRMLASEQAPIVRISGDPSMTEVESLPLVWEGSGIWGSRNFTPPTVGGGAQ